MYSKQEERIKKAIRQFEQTSRLSIFEPCDCGTQIRHNNGGNYHQEIYLKADQGIFVKYEDTCELVPEGEWESCPDWRAVIQEYADWL